MFLCPEKFCWTNALDVCRVDWRSRSLASLVAGLTERSGAAPVHPDSRIGEDREGQAPEAQPLAFEQPRFPSPGQPAGASGGGDRKKAAFRSDPRSVGPQADAAQLEAAAGDWTFYVGK